VTNAAIAFLTAAFVSLLIGPNAINILSRLKLRQTVSEDVPERHREKQGTPTMGGLIILLGAGVGTAIRWVAYPKVLAAVLLIIGYAILGFVDDYLIVSRGRSLGLKARHKLLGQFVLAAAFLWWVYANRVLNTSVVHFGNGIALDLGWVYYPLAVLMIVGMSNAVNLNDGLDGLAAGLTAITGLALGTLVFPALEGGLSIIAWALAGGCVGFLWYNTNPAKVFMGDTGSLSIGAGMAAIAVLGKAEFFYLLIGIVFVIEAVSVMIQVASFKLTGKRIFKMTPIHHHFELSGWPEQRIVVRFWIAGGLAALAVLAWAGVFDIRWGS